MSGAHEALRTALTGLDGALVAFSGGADSALLLAVAHDVLGDRAVALTAVGPSLLPSEAEAARRLARRLGVVHLELPAGEHEVPEYRRNGPDRCYHCKAELFRLCRREADRLGLRAVLYGANADDPTDHRPGHRAAEEAGARAPLLEAGLGKEAVRALSRELGLETWDKPSLACLASRIPWGTEVTGARLVRVARAEEGLRALGLSSFRVRDHDPVARLEVGEAEWTRLSDPTLRRGADAACRDAGFAFVALDLRPFRSGSLSSAQLGRPAGSR